MAQDDDIKFVKENSIASKPITKKDLEKPELVIGFMKNEKGSGYDPSQKEGNVLTIKKRGDVYDFYKGDELRPFSAGIDADEVLRVLNNRTAGYTYLATSRKDPKLARWRDIDDEDIYTNRLRSDADPTRPLEFIGEKGKPVTGKVLTEIQFIKKAKAGTLTVAEAIEYGESIAKLPSHIENIPRLRKHMAELGLDLDMPYKDLKNHASKFNPEGAPEGVKATNRTSSLQSLDIVLREKPNSPFQKYGVVGVLEDVGEGEEITMYPKLAGAGTEAGTQRTGLQQARPMRGLLSKAKFDKIYEDNLPKVVSDFGQNTADIMEYHSRTATRPSQLVALTKDDVIVDDDTVTIKGKDKDPANPEDKKFRPEMTYDKNSKMGQLVLRNFESSPTDSLFNVTEAQFDNAFNKHISPGLTEYEKVLPLVETEKVKVEGKVASTKIPYKTKGVVRHIVPRYLQQEFKIDKGLIEGFMGHVDRSTLSTSYTGIVPEEDLPKLVDDPTPFSRGETKKGKGKIDLSLLTEEDRQAIYKEEGEAVLAEQKARTAKAGAVQAASEAERVRTLAEMSPEDIEQANQTQMLLEQGKAEAAQAGAELRQDQRKNKALETGRQAMEDLLNLVGTDPTKIKTGIATTLLAAKQAASNIPGPFGDLASVAIDPESFDVADKKGRQTVRELFGPSPTLEAVGGTAAVAGEMITGAVADPKSARTMGMFAVSPLLGMMQQSLAKSKPGPQPQIQAPPPTQGTNLEAQQATGMVNQARRAAMRGEETSMTGSFLQPPI